MLVAAVALVVSMWLASVSIVPGWWLLVNSVVVLAAVLFERRGYDPKTSHPEALQPTGERFRDPTTDQLIEVWEDPQTGAREYRPTSHV